MKIRVKEDAEGWMRKKSRRDDMIIEKTQHNIQTFVSGRAK